MRKPVSIAMSETENWTSYFVLCDDGAMFRTHWDGAGGMHAWIEVPSVPQPEDK